MGKAIIRLSSVTYGIRAQKLLEHRGIRCTIKKISHNAQISGCGYGVEVSGSDIETARETLLNAGIRIIDIEY